MVGNRVTRHGGIGRAAIDAHLPLLFGPAPQQQDKDLIRLVGALGALQGGHTLDRQKQPVLPAHEAGCDRRPILILVKLDLAHFVLGRVAVVRLIILLDLLHDRPPAHRVVPLRAAGKPFVARRAAHDAGQTGMRDQGDRSAGHQGDACQHLSELLHLGAAVLVAGEDVGR